MSDTTILIIDDEPVTLASMSKVLASGYWARAANTGARATESAERDVEQPVEFLALTTASMSSSRSPAGTGPMIEAKFRDIQATWNHGTLSPIAHPKVRQNSDG